MSYCFFRLYYSLTYSEMDFVKKGEKWIFIMFQSPFCAHPVLTRQRINSGAQCSADSRTGCSFLWFLYILVLFSYSVFWYCGFFMTNVSFLLNIYLLAIYLCIWFVHRHVRSLWVILNMVDKGVRGNGRYSLWKNYLNIKIQTNAFQCHCKGKIFTTYKTGRRCRKYRKEDTTLTL